MLASFVNVHNTDVTRNGNDKDSVLVLDEMLLPFILLVLKVAQADWALIIAWDFVYVTWYMGLEVGTSGS